MDTFRDVSTDGKVSSPLKNFAIAKKRIGEIYADVLNYVNEASTHIIDMNIKCPSALTENEFKSILGYRSKVQGISEVLTRDHMKVVFFGRTSNGKSTVVNAMLRDKVLPSGIGHTTNCFLQVEGSQQDKAYLVIAGSSEEQNVDSVSHLAHALNHKKQLDEKELVHIYWPKDKCSLLRDDVALVDSPGVDITPHLDDWIDAHCTDADVFVLVNNAESTLMVTEKNFFHKVSSKLSKPNIFILNNRWDASANELDLLDQVRKQHMGRATDFLVKELKVCTMEEASTRVFFISAKEVLQARLQERNGLSLNSGALAEGFSERYKEFEEFEHRFEECISMSAIKTKFLKHSQQGKLIITETCQIIDKIYYRSQEQKNHIIHQIKVYRDKINYTQKQFHNITNSIKNKINQMVDNAQREVYKALEDEIRKLSDLIEQFDWPFDSDPSEIQVYKNGLRNHMESGLGNNMQTRLSQALNIELVKREMVEAISALLPAEKSHINLIQSYREPFKVLCLLNYDNICEDFHEQLEFKFSWCLSKLITQVSSLATKSRIERIEFLPNEHVSMLAGILTTHMGTQGTVTVGLILSGFMLKILGLRFTIVTAGIYGGLYAYGRFAWTKKDKQIEFKRQYVDHVKVKLYSIVGHTSINCSHQVEQELSTNFAQLTELVDRFVIDLTDRINVMNCELNILNNSTEIIKTFKNKANPLKAKLKQFDDIFLS